MDTLMSTGHTMTSRGKRGFLNVQFCIFGCSMEKPDYTLQEETIAALNDNFQATKEQSIRHEKEVINLTTQFVQWQNEANIIHFDQHMKSAAIVRTN